MRSVHERHRLALTALAAGSPPPRGRATPRAPGHRGRTRPGHAAVGALRTGPGRSPSWSSRWDPAPRMRCRSSAGCPGPTAWTRRTWRGPERWAGSASRRSPTTRWPRPPHGWAAPETTLVRYHPGRRATVRVTGPTDLPTCPVAYAKVFSDNRGAARYDLSEAAGRGRDDGTARPARPAARGVRRRPVRALAARGRGRAGDRPADPAGRHPRSPRGSAPRWGACTRRGWNRRGGSPPRACCCGLSATRPRPAGWCPRWASGSCGCSTSVGADSSSGQGRTVPVHGSPDPGPVARRRGPRPRTAGLRPLRLGGSRSTDVACFLVEVEALGQQPGLAPPSADGFLAGYQSRGRPGRPRVAAAPLHHAPDGQGGPRRAGPARRRRPPGWAGPRGGERAAAARDAIATSVAGR